MKLCFLPLNILNFASKGRGANTSKKEVREENSKKKEKTLGKPFEQNLLICLDLVLLYLLKSQ